MRGGCTGPVMADTHERAKAITEEFLSYLRQYHKLDRPYPHNTSDGNNLEANTNRHWDAYVVEFEELVRKIVYNDDCANF
jgi:hypothetical protein